MAWVITDEVSAFRIQTDYTIEISVDSNDYKRMFFTFVFSQLVDMA